jgi:RNA polymerase sigma factor (sigma-70 family)
MIFRLKPSPGLISDEKIAEDLLKGEGARRKAEEQLFSRYSYYIKEGMKKYGLTEDQAFDAYSDTIIACITAIIQSKFEERSSLKTFVYRVFANKCVDVIRKHTTNKEAVHRFTDISESLQMLSDSAKTIIQTLIEKADHLELTKKLDRLGDNCRKLLTMFAEGYSDRQIASSMQYNSADVVKTSRLRCLQKLRHEYAT